MRALCRLGMVASYYTRRRGGGISFKGGLESNASVSFTGKRLSEAGCSLPKPFVLFVIPLGRLADLYIGEKEIMTAGFILTAFAVASIGLVENTSFLVFTTILFLTRMGASAIEITSESYFFKHVSSDDPDIISIFRMMRPLAYVLAPFVAAICLIFLSFTKIYFVLAIIVFFGIKFSLALKDTK